MPSYNTQDWEGFRFKAQPLGIRQRKGMFLLPYFTGSRPHLKVSIDRISGEGEIVDAAVLLYVPGEPLDGSGKKPLMRLPKLEAGKAHIESVKELSPLAMTGDYVVALEVNLLLPSDAKRKRFYIAFFKVAASETAVVAFLSLAVGALITLLITIAGALVSQAIGGWGNTTQP